MQCLPVKLAFHCGWLHSLPGCTSWPTFTDKLPWRLRPSPVLLGLCGEATFLLIASKNVASDEHTIEHSFLVNPKRRWFGRAWADAKLILVMKGQGFRCVIGETHTAMCITTSTLHLDAHNIEDTGTKDFGAALEKLTRLTRWPSPDYLDSTVCKYKDLDDPRV